VRTIRLQAAKERRAIYNDTSVQTLGTLVLDHITAIGQVQILAKDRIRGGYVSVNGLDIPAADARERSARPHGYGVSVLQGAFTLWNQQPAELTALSAELVGISLGREGAPVLGSGVFVSGAGFEGSSLRVSRLETGSILQMAKSRREPLISSPEGSSSSTAHTLTKCALMGPSSHMDPMIWCWTIGEMLTAGLLKVISGRMDPAASGLSTLARRGSSTPLSQLRPLVLAYRYVRCHGPQSNAIASTDLSSGIRT
jgi:hypothetical protein